MIFYWDFSEKFRNKMSNKVYTKDFNVKSLGYCCEEVDAFLDEINMEIVRLEREIEEIIQMYNKNNELADLLNNEFSLNSCYILKKQTDITIFNDLLLIFFETRV